MSLTSSTPTGAAPGFVATSAQTAASHADTIAAIATAPGRGAIAIVRVSGPAARTVASRVVPTRRLRPRVAERGAVIAADGTAIDDGLALFFAAPNSYTGEDVLEIHVHGSPAVARDTLLATLSAGARLAGPGEFTRRAFEAGKLDLCAAEAVAELIAAEHRGAARAAAARLSGGLASEVDRLRRDVAEIAEHLAASLDFPDEVEAPQRHELVARVTAIDDALEELSRSWERGQLIREGINIAIVGPPNAGKSSLLNALLGADRALVSERAGTTRDTIEESVALGEGVVSRLVDTAGLGTSNDALEAAGIARSEAALERAAVVLVVLDGSRPLAAEARALLGRTRERSRLVYFNKADLGRAGFDRRDAEEADALLGSAFDRASVEAVRLRLLELAGGDRVDLARPHLGTARQADAVLEARRALAFARETLAAGAEFDLIVPDLMAANAALAGLEGRDASEALLDAIFARFCIGK